jgi:hypothetical protein
MTDRAAHIAGGKQAGFKKSGCFSSTRLTILRVKIHAGQGCKTSMDLPDNSNARATHLSRLQCHDPEVAAAMNRR